ncbi:uncharacterized protein [Cherax quadricarinatus]|uniref:uncharacterized protein n=1 Tax=Cherax quadricarinatus TaxID=27406 RepID=UPI00387E3A85
MRSAVLVVVGVLCLTAAAAEGVQQQDEQSKTAAAAEGVQQQQEQQLKPAEAAEGVQKQLAVAASSTYTKPPDGISDQERFIFGRYSTTTYTDVVMVTSTVFFSCLSGSSTVLCRGRRRKRSSSGLSTVNDENIKNSNLGDILESSQDDSTPASTTTDSIPQDKETPESDKFFINVWTTTHSTTTVTMLYTNTSTTIRLSYFCQAGQLQLPTFRCVG